MKRMKQIGIYLAGFVTATVIFLSANSAWAAGVLQTIYVDFDPIKIFIDGQERNPPADMQPFIYNGRTYVSLRYAGEAFGKKVDWDGATRSVVITEPRAQLSQYTESFSDQSSAGKYWIQTGGGTWKYDGPNGLHINSVGQLTLFDVLPNSYCNYTVEFEVANTLGTAKQSPNTHSCLVSFCIGKDNNGNLGDAFTIQGLSGIRYLESEQSRKDPLRSYQGNNIDIMIPKWIPEYESNEYVPVLIQVKDRYANIYINGVYIASKEMSMGTSAFAFLGHGTGDYSSYYIRNFKLTLDQ